MCMYTHNTRMYVNGCCPKTQHFVVLSSNFQQEDHLWFAQLTTVSKAVSLLPKRAGVRVFFFF